MVAGCALASMDERPNAPRPPVLVAPSPGGVGAGVNSGGSSSRVGNGCSLGAVNSEALDPMSLMWFDSRRSSSSSRVNATPGSRSNLTASSLSIHFRDHVMSNQPHLLAPQTVRADNIVPNTGTSADSDLASLPVTDSSAVDVVSCKCFASGGSSSARQGSTPHTVKYIGVRLRGKNRWVAEIKDNNHNVRKWLGTFACPVQAAQAFDAAARAIRGPHAKTNFKMGHPNYVPSIADLPKDLITEPLASIASSFAKAASNHVGSRRRSPASAVPRPNGETVGQAVPPLLYGSSSLSPPALSSPEHSPHSHGSHSIAPPSCPRVSVLYPAPPPVRRAPNAAPADSSAPSVGRSFNSNCVKTTAASAAAAAAAAAASFMPAGPRDGTLLNPPPVCFSECSRTVPSAPAAKRTRYESGVVQRHSNAADHWSRAITLVDPDAPSQPEAEPMALGSSLANCVRRGAEPGDPIVFADLWSRARNGTLCAEDGQGLRATEGMLECQGESPDVAAGDAADNDIIGDFASPESAQSGSTGPWILRTCSAPLPNLGTRFAKPAGASFRRVSSSVKHPPIDLNLEMEHSGGGSWLSL